MRYEKCKMQESCFAKTDSISRKLADGRIAPSE